jgi:anti-sigma-K factor RskA
MPNPNKMSVQNEYSDLVSAYSLGCLDKADLLELNEYFQTSNEFPWQELGEYQNLAALLPAILNTESPRQELKDKVARKLYRIKNERQPNRVFGNITPVPSINRNEQSSSAGEKEDLPDYFEQSKPPANTGIPESGENSKNDLTEKDTQPNSTLKVENIQDEIPDEEIPANITPEIEDDAKINKIDTMEIELKRVSARRKAITNKGEKKPYQLHGLSEPKSEKKGRGGIIFLIILLVTLLAGFIYFYMNYSSNIEIYKSGVEKLNKQVSDLTNQASVNKEVQKILLMKDAHIINLYGSSFDKEGYGKIILSFESSSGFLQLSNLPELKNGMSYQLWMTADGKTVSLGNFIPVNNSYYFPVTFPVQNYKGEIKFFVTMESSSGSPKPSGLVYLIGMLQ